MKDPFLNLTEKYRPEKLSDIVGHPNIVNRFSSYIKKGRMPHLLFAGPAGCGKTASAEVLAKELYGKNWDLNLHTFDSSSTRGIDFIRGTIKDLCEIEPVGANFQIILLDECDGLTSDAQTALRQTMMRHTATTKFILCCNYMFKIIGPIQDRCRIFRFGKIEDESIAMNLIKICELESQEFEPDALLYVAEKSRGSMRAAIENLETYMEEDQKITLDLVTEDMPYVGKEEIRPLLKLVKENNVPEYHKILYKLTYSGFHAREILEAILTEIDLDTSNKLYSSEFKIKVDRIIGECDWRISQGSNDLIQLRSMLRYLGD